MGGEYVPRIIWHKCNICKKKFNTYSAYEGWAYAVNNGKVRRWFCSYSCMREWEKKKEATRKYKTRDSIGR